jgi:nitrite reductase/ring-hydroxylating ferredoxin subunit
MVLLCHLDDIPEQGSLGFDPHQEGRDTVFIVRQGAALYAYRDMCPHYGDTALPWRKDVYLDTSGQNIICASHGARFDITSGLCTLGPCLGQSLTGITLQVTEEGQVFANL